MMGSHNQITSYLRRLRSMFGIANHSKGVIKGGVVARLKDNINTLAKLEKQVHGQWWSQNRCRPLTSGCFDNTTLTGELPAKSCWYIWAEIAGR